MELAGARVIVAKVEPGVLKLELVVLSVLYFPVSWVRPYSQVKNRALKELRVETHFLGERPAWPLLLVYRGKIRLKQFGKRHPQSPSQATITPPISSRGRCRTLTLQLHHGR